MTQERKQLKKNRRETLSRPPSNSSYVYAIVVDGVVRYIGKGRNDRMFFHMKEARWLAKRCGARTNHISPFFHRMLVRALRAGATVREMTLISELSDAEAYRVEGELIGQFHKGHAGQLWNTIDERFLDPKYLPDEWTNPVEPMYRLPRPLGWLLPGGAHVQSTSPAKAGPCLVQPSSSSLVNPAEP